MNKLFKITISLLLLFLFVHNLICETQFFKPNFKNFGLDYGIRTIVKDSDGFIWIGTDNSLIRFDGYNITQFVHNPDDSTTISSKNISCIKPDKRGNLWIATMGGGLNLFIKETNSFKRFYSVENDNNSLSHNWVNRIFVDSKERLWICTQNGLNLFDYNTLKFNRYMLNLEKIEKPSGLTKSSLLDISEDNNGNLWLTTSDALHKFQPSNNKHIKFGKAFFNVKSEFRNICIDENNIIWLSSHKGPMLKVIAENFKDTTHLKIKSYFKNEYIVNSLPDDRISKIIPAQNDHLWIATENGVSYFNKITESFKNYYHNPNNEQSLPSNIITELYLDNQNILWVGTLNNGIAQYDPNNNRFTDLFPIINNTTDPIQRFVKSIFKDNSEKYLIGTDYGLFEFSKTKQLLNQYIHNPTNPNSIGRGGVTGIVIDNQGRHWVTTWGGGLALFDVEGKLFNRIPYNPDSVFSSNYIGDIDIRAVAKDLNGNLWLGTTKGFLDEFNPLTYKFKHHFIFDKDSLRGVAIRSIAVDNENNIWATTTPQGILVKYNRESGKIIHYGVKKFVSVGLGTVEALSIYIDKENTVWVGSSHGLYKYNKSTDNFINHSILNQIPTVPIQYLTGDNLQSLWMASSQEIIEYNLMSKKHRLFDQNDGFFSMVSYGYLSADGELLLGGKNGLNAFYPHKLSVNENPPPMVLTELRINDQIQTIQTPNTPLTKEINWTNVLVLEHDQSTFSISYAALNYSQTYKNQYAFMLDGLDNDWNYVGTRRTAFYTDLRPGKYIFRVKGSNNDGVWNPESKSIIIIVNPPWYNSPWAYVVYFIIVALLIFIIIYYTNERQKLKHRIEIQKLNFDTQYAINQKEKELNESKLQFFSNISHEIRTPLTLILSPLYDVIQNEKLNSESKRSLMISHLNAKRLHKLVNQLLDLSKVEAGFMRLELVEDNISDTIKTIVESITPKANKKSVYINFTMNVLNAMAFFDRDKIEKILTNLIDNAIKHAPKETYVDIKVNILQRESKPTNLPNVIYADSVTIEVSDRGKGISPEIIDTIFEKFYQAKGEQGAGIGLFLAKSLVHIHKGQISVISEPNIETRFSFTLPVSKSAFPNTIIIDNYSKDDILYIEDTERDFKIDEPLNFDIAGLPIILIIEDEDDLCNYIKSIFSHYNVFTASNGMEGLSKAQEIIPDIIICDIMMPGMDGYEFTKTIKNSKSTSHIPVILLTAKATNDERIAGLEIGADDYISKPFDSNTLLLKVNNQIKTRREFARQFISDPSGNIEKLIHNSSDKKFITNLTTIIELNYKNPEFDFQIICSEIGMSRAQLYRKVKALTDKSVHEYIRIFRLKKAAQMLLDEGLNISEIMYSVGFNNHSYFSKCFKQFYGVLPSEYVKKRK